MKKLLSIFLLLPLLFFASCSSDDSGDSGKKNQKRGELYSVSNKSAFDYFTENNLVGINIGDTFDAHRNGKAGEEVWNKPPVSQALMDGISGAGFTLVRIPITWMDNIGGAPKYTVDKKQLKRIEEVVLMAHNAGLKAIINMHHDDNDTATGGWLSISQSRNPTQKAAIEDKYTKAWTQIAKHFKKYGEWLMFESFNEPHYQNSWETSPDNIDYQTINDWNQAFTNAVRGTGGNNKQRILIIPAYANRRARLLDSFFTQPNDTASLRQAVSFHYYDPYPFGQQETNWQGVPTSTWGSQTERNIIDTHLKQLNDEYINRGIAVIMGECGVVLKLYNSLSEPERTTRREEARLSRREYLPFLFSTAKKYNISPVFWENGVTTGNGEKFGLFNRRTGAPNDDEETQWLINAMIDAVKD